jgi:hypothetical protein
MQITLDIADVPLETVKRIILELEEEFKIPISLITEESFSEKIDTAFDDTSEHISG